MKRKTAPEVRQEAARIALRWADEREACGDTEGAGQMRDLAKAIARIRLDDRPPTLSVAMIRRIQAEIDQVIADAHIPREARP